MRLLGFFHTRDIKRAFRLARELEVGMVGVNDSLISTCEAPFGGEYINIKYNINSYQ